MNPIDKLIGFFSPQTALKRAGARAAMDKISAVSGGSYSGASMSRKSLQGWTPKLTDGASDTTADIPVLRARARDLTRNAPLAVAAETTLVDSVVGTGLEMTPELPAEFLGLDLETSAAWGKRAKFLFRTWAEDPDSIDFDRSLDFYRLQTLVLRTVFSGGDAWVLLPMEPRPGQTIETRVRIIDPDLVSNPNQKQDSPNLVGGVEMDSFGRPVAIWVSNKHPNSKIDKSGTIWNRVPIYSSDGLRRNVLHIWDPQRLGQVRGVSWLAPIIEKLKQLDRYTDAELTAAVISSFFTVFITNNASNSQNGQLLEDMIAPEDKITNSAADQISMEMAPGAIVGLGNGDDVKFADPKRPNTAFEGFISAVTHEIASGLGIPADILTKKFDASYSASRAAFLEAWRHFKRVRALIVSDFCQPVYSAWLDETIARGILSAPKYFESREYRFAWSRATWRGDAPGTLDPIKETRSAIMQMEAGIRSGEAVAAEMFAEDYDATLLAVAREEKIRRNLDLKPVAGNPTPDNPEDFQQ